MDLIKQNLIFKLARAQAIHRLAMSQSKKQLVSASPAVAATRVVALGDQLWDYSHRGIVPANTPKA